MNRQKYLEGGQKRQILHIETNYGECIIAIPHRLNSMELSLEEFKDNLFLRCGLMPQVIPVNCNGHGKKLSIYEVLSFPKGVLFWVVMATLQRSGTPLEPGPLPLVIYTTKLKSSVGHYRGEEPG